jgi:hypothetical protein
MKLRKVVGLIFGTVLLFWIGLDQWGRFELSDYQIDWQHLVDAERVRLAAVRHPVIDGPPTADNAADHENAVLERLRTVIDAKVNRALYSDVLGRAMRAGPATPPPAEVAALLEKHRGDLDALAVGLRAERCDWHLRLEQGFSMKFPSLLGARVLASLLVLDGHRLARAGDASAAARRYLQVVRFGIDFGDEPLLIMSLMGTALCRIGLDGLGALLLSDLPHPPLADLDASLGRLAPALPNMAAGFRGERIAIGSLANRSGSELHADFIHSNNDVGGRLAAMILPWRPVVADTIGEAWPVLQEMERSTTVGRGEAARIEAEMGARVARSHNPFTRMSLPSLTRSRRSADDLRAVLALVRAVAHIEAARGADGRYPADPERPADPNTEPAAPLRYTLAPDGRGYKLWSIGSDGKDDGGRAGGGADLVLERVASRP